MANILSPIDLENWLNGKPRGLAVGMASRIALRVLPLALSVTERTDLKEPLAQRLTLAMIQAIAISRSAVGYPDREFTDFAVSCASANATDVANAAYNLADAACAAATAAYNVADAAFTKFPAGCAASSAHAAAAVAYAAAGIPKESGIYFFLLDRNAAEDGGPLLANIDVDGIRFKVDDSPVITLRDPSIVDFSKQGTGAYTHQDFVERLQDELQALIAMAIVPADTVLYVDRLAINKVPDRSVAETFLENGTRFSPIPGIVLVTSTAAEFKPVGFTMIDDHLGLNNVYRRFAEAPPEDGVTRAVASSTIFSAISDDCRWWDMGNRKVSQLLARPLWPDERPGFFSSAYRDAMAYWRDQPENWSNWNEWYDRRLDGQHCEWPLPPQQDAEMARRLIEAGEDFWECAEEVNFQIGRWLEELRGEAEGITQSPATKPDSPSPPLLPEEVDQAASRFASPEIVFTAANKLSAVPNIRVDAPKDARSLSALVTEMLVLLPPTYSSLGRNAPKLLKTNLRTYKAELKTNRNSACWGSLDRLMANAELCTAASEPEMFDAGMAEQLGQVFTLHKKCMEALTRPAGLDEAVDRINVDDPAASDAIEQATQGVAAGLKLIEEHNLADRSYIKHLQVIIVSGHDNALSIAQGVGGDGQRRAVARKWIFGTLGVVIQTLSVLGSLASLAPFVLPKEQLDAIMIQFQSAAGALRKLF